MEFNPMIVIAAIDLVKTELIERMYEIEQRAMLEYYHELFMDISSFVEPIAKYKSVQHLMVMLPERIRDIEKELNYQFEFDEAFKELIGWA